ncbi:peptidoglycan-binding protein LysM [Zunongwangia sp. F363]|uniref:Peptidoglycan-binding protein LysM n=1 Tax=Autumnicola tepida TaxID=3075595 RepID=A0ABU3C711_9FLAO|nr:peptidoglycan-binding protein LysM [Zunongwangia sp. F363]MDT0641982.1 peptidoglycan-binding protein LysM [Zunongwangia sp. F363]
MGIFSFIKEAGEKLFGVEKAEAEESHEISDSHEAKEQKEDIKASSRLRNRIAEAGLEVKDLKIAIEGDTAIISGSSNSEEVREKAILIVGNSEGIAKVEDKITVENKGEESSFHTVERDDTLGKIAKDHYGDEEKYPLIFEANKPMLKDPDKIYPGQVLRIPALDKDKQI